MPTYPPRGVTALAHSYLNQPTASPAIGRSVGLGNQIPQATNPTLFGRPAWTYVQVQQAPRHGPQPRLAQGTGRTSIQQALPGNAAQLPGYLADNQYEPVIPDYQPPNAQVFQRKLARSISVGTDGLAAINPTYRAHDFTPADRWLGTLRSAPNWQTMNYPPDFRNLLAWQQVMRYRVNSLTVAARPLDSSQYFLGYQINPNVAKSIGQSTLGYMGSQ